MTRLFTIASILIIVIVDVGFAVSGRETISEFIYEISRNYPIVAAAFGVLLGHWFWPMRSNVHEQR